MPLPYLSALLSQLFPQLPKIGEHHFTPESDIDRVQFASLKKLVSQNGGPSPFLP